jgi:serine protease Do
MSVWKTGLAACALTAAVGIGMAVAPAPEAQEREPLTRALQMLGHGAQIGVTVRDLDGTEAAKSNGIIVDEVRSGSPAEKAGVKKGDRIVEFDGERVRSVAQFRRLVQETPEGRNVNTIVQRDGQRVTVSVTPDRGGRALYFRDDDFLPTPAIPPMAPAAPTPPPAPRLPRSFDFGEFMFESGNGRLGASLENLTDQLRTFFGVKNGVLVRSVREGTPAAAAGLKAGDVITIVNGHTVDEPSDVTSELRRLDSGGEFTLEVMRDRKTQTLKGKVEARTDRARTRTVT